MALSPATRREHVGRLTGEGVCSIRAWCRMLKLARSTWRYRGKAPSEREKALHGRLAELSVKHPRHGYQRIAALLRQEGREVESDGSTCRSMAADRTHLSSLVLGLFRKRTPSWSGPSASPSGSVRSTTAWEKRARGCGCRVRATPSKTPPKPSASVRSCAPGSRLWNCRPGDRSGCGCSTRCVTACTASPGGSGDCPATGRWPPCSRCTNRATCTGRSA